MSTNEDRQSRPAPLQPSPSSLDSPTANLLPRTQSSGTYGDPTQLLAAISKWVVLRKYGAVLFFIVALLAAGVSSAAKFVKDAEAKEWLADFAAVLTPLVLAMGMTLAKAHGSTRDARAAARTAGINPADHPSHFPAHA